MLYLLSSHTDAAIIALNAFDSVHYPDIGQHFDGIPNYAVGRLVLMYILGISAYYHDSAAALVADGQIAAAVQEERFTRKKHDAGFPTKDRNPLGAKAR